MKLTMINIKILWKFLQDEMTEQFLSQVEKKHYHNLLQIAMEVKFNTNIL